MKIGISLSGGGIRATVFHLGVLERLALDQLLEDVSFISTVSGGSLCAGLILSANQCQWPSSAWFTDVIVPHIRTLLTKEGIQKKYILRKARSLLTRFRFDAADLSAVFRQYWGISASLDDLPDTPRWIINASCHETGNRWRFEKKRMGDYSFGLATHPSLLISDAIAASAAIPHFVGPFILDTNKYAWVKYKEGSTSETEPTVPAFTKVHLWDGAMVDSFGVEALFKVDKGLRDGVDFLVVSDASAPMMPQPFRLRLRTFLRLYEITSHQVQALRTRHIMDRLMREKSIGRYLKIGNSGRYILREAGWKEEIALRATCLGDEEIRSATNIGTTLRQLTEAEFEGLFRHGFEVADFTLHAYGADQYCLMEYKAKAS